MSLTQQQREKIILAHRSAIEAIDTASSEHLKTKFPLFNDIPAKKIANFKKMLAKNNVSVDNEEIIFFYDLTIFGSGKEGSLITNTSIYHIDTLGFKQAKFSDISQFHYEDGNTQGVGQTFIDLKDNTKLSYISAKWMFDIINAIFAALGVVMAEKIELVQFDRLEKAQCQNCRAWTRHEICEYCRTPVARGTVESISIVTTTSESTVVPTHQVVTGVGVADELLKLKQLMDAGLLSREEFEHKKKLLLGM